MVTCGPQKMPEDGGPRGLYGCSQLVEDTYE